MFQPARAGALCRALGMLFVGFLSMPALGQSRLYVNLAAPPGGNGQTWAAAYQGVRPALQYANTHPSVTEIWVAQGVYLTGATQFQLVNGVALYGGFSGGETQLSQRDWRTRVTTLDGGSATRVLSGPSGPSSDTILDGFRVTRGRAGQGAGLLAFNGAMVVRNCTFEANTATSSGGGVYGYDANTFYINCRFIGNSGGSGGAAAAFNYEGSPTFVNCEFYGNSTPGSGAALDSYTGSPTLINCVLAENTASAGAAIYSHEGFPTLINCTITGNASTIGGVALIETTKGAGTMANCIVYGNPEVSLSANWTVRYSCVEGGFPGPGNIAAAPIFRNAAQRDYRLAYRSGSPGIDAGENVSLPDDTADADGDGDIIEQLPIDARGADRRQDDPNTADSGNGGAPLVDMGAYEYFDDCNDNGVADSVDIASGTSLDINGSGVPDDCEDCNGNGILDDCDVTCGGFCAGVVGCGQSLDCNSNQIPDECELATRDCNNNGRPDDCDIAAASSLDCQSDGIPDECQLGPGDCNNNGIPDACDVAGGASADCQNDGIPDECQLGPTPPIEYRVDDGSSKDQLGLSNGGSIGWINRLQVQTRGATIGEVRFAWGAVADGTQATIYIWSDPNQDGNPVDAQVLSSATVTANNAQVDEFILVDVPDVVVGPVGAHFFVGAIAQHAAGDLPAPIDLSGDGGRSWLVADGAQPIDPNNLALANTPPAPAAGFGFPGNWLIRGVSTSVPNDCNANGIPDSCDIAVGFSDDCQPNGIPDECDLAQGPTTDLDGNSIPDECEDCNRNRIPDGWDIDAADPDNNGQVSDDCQPDGVPDECQLGSIPQPARYVYDDGVSEFSVGEAVDSYVAWLNRYTVQPGAEVITTIQVAFGPGTAGTPVTINVWSDPNGDGNPADAQRITSVAGAIPSSGPLFTSFAISPLNLGPAGTSFFVGVMGQFPGNVFFARFDGTDPTPGQSWLAGSTSPIDPNNLSAGTYEFDTIDVLINQVGNWLIRAEGPALPPANDQNSNGIPDECELRGDMNCDGFMTVGDISGFVQALTDPAGYAASFPNCDINRADVNGDGFVTVGDIGPFVALLTGP